MSPVNATPPLISGTSLTIAACAGSAVALADAALLDLGRTPPWDETTGTAWALAAVAAVHAVTYLALAVGLAPFTRTRAGRVKYSTWAARLLVASLTALAAVFLSWTVVARPVHALDIVAGPAFLLMLVSALTLGVALVRGRTHTRAGLLLLTPLALLPALIGLSALGWDGAHPAYLETPLYFGCALLAGGLRPALPASAGTNAANG